MSEPREAAVTNELLVTLAVVCIAIAGLWRLQRRRRSDADWLPADMRQAPLVFAERKFRSARPGLVAKVDRAYRRDGQLLLVELKTRRRHRIHDSDIIELSAQKVAVEGETGQCVAGDAFVLTDVQSGPRVSHRVRLLDRDAVQAIILRREAIVSGRERPNYARDQGICRDCGFRKECDPPWPKRR